MSKEMWSQVKKFSDGENLDAKTLNVPIGQLGDRTAYLHSKLMELYHGGKMASVVLTGVRISTDEGSAPEVGNAVYLDCESGCFAAAKATMSLYDDFTSANSAFTVGILTKRDNMSGFGNVLVYGSLDMGKSGPSFLERNMIETGEAFRPGRYYLSSRESGKLTAHPNGPIVYVCTVSGSVSSGAMNGTAIVSPQFLDIGTSHVHRTAVLTARPAGTNSVDGYLPIDATVGTGSSGPLALRFGGTWTSDAPVDYKFYLDQGSADWPNGVVLRWSENGHGDFSVRIPAPDAEVRLTNGLTVRLSLPDSGPLHAYSGLSEDRRTWAAMTFPFAGRGWTRHSAETSARSGTVDGLEVAVRGSDGKTRSNMKVAFPGDIQILTAGAADSGVRLSYGGLTYVFISDGDDIADGEIPVDVGPCLADSIRNLAEELNKSGSGAFAVFGSESGSSAKLLAMDGLEIGVDGSLFTGRETKSCGPFDVVGASGVSAVVFDDTCFVRSETAIVENVSSYVWRKSGNVEIMVYQTLQGTVTVPSGTIASGVLVDDAPGAKYDYVVGFDAQISNYWPPVPPRSAALLVNGVEADNEVFVPDSPTVSFGRRTIHWFKDGAGMMPWPEAFVSRDEGIDPSREMHEVMHWVRGFQGATGPVTSIRTRPGSPLKIFGYGSDDVANVGDLEIDAEFDFRIVGGGAPGFMVPKRAVGGKMIAGPVVERIVGGAGVNVISGAGCPRGQGTVVIALDNGAYASQFTDIALENAEQAKIGMFPYLRLKGYSGTIASTSAFTATMRVPANLPDMKYALKLTASVFGEAGFVGRSKRAACVNFSYNILPDFTAVDTMRYRDLKTSLLKPDGERTVLIPFGHSSGGDIVYNGFDPILISTEDDELTDEDDVVAKAVGRKIPDKEEFKMQVGVIPELKPGYLVGIRFTRAVTPDISGVEAYNGAIGFINLSWSLVLEESSDKAASPVMDEDIYARDRETGLYHAVVAVRDEETGVVDIGIEQQGVKRNK